MNNRKNTPKTQQQTIGWMNIPFGKVKTSKKKFFNILQINWPRNTNNKSIKLLRNLHTKKSHKRHKTQFHIKSLYNGVYSTGRSGLTGHTKRHDTISSTFYRQHRHKQVNTAKVTTKQAHVQIRSKHVIRKEL